MSAVPATRELSGGIDYLGRIVSFCVGQGERREVGRDVISVACQKIILCPIFLPLVSVVPILEISYRCSVILLFFFCGARNPTKGLTHAWRELLPTGPKYRSIQYVIFILVFWLFPVHKSVVCSFLLLGSSSLYDNTAICLFFVVGDGN